MKTLMKKMETFLIKTRAGFFKSRWLFSGTGQPQGKITILRVEVDSVVVQGQLPKCGAKKGSPGRVRGSAELKRWRLESGTAGVTGTRRAGNLQGPCEGPSQSITEDRAGHTGRERLHEACREKRLWVRNKAARLAAWRHCAVLGFSLVRARGPGTCFVNTGLLGQGHAFACTLSVPETV